MNRERRFDTGPESAWPWRLSVATLAAAVPLVFFGGSVTTLHAGLAIDGWLVLEPGRGDHFLWLYPIDKWFRDLGTFVEHTHRLFGSLVGLLAIATVVATWSLSRRRSARFLTLVALLAVVVQGTIGGLRVLERSADLAFLHGAIAQAVFALLGAACVALSPAFAAFRPSAEHCEGSAGPRLRRLASTAVAVAYVQVLAGAWLRHGGGMNALVLHLVVAGAVFVVAVLLAGQMRLASGEAPAAARTRILSLRRWLIGSLAIQIALGIASMVVVSTPEGSVQSVGVGTAVVPTLHVVVGGVLLLACVASAMWARRAFPDRALESRRDLEPKLQAETRWEAAR